MHSSGGERFEEEQLTQLGRAERRVGSWGLTEKRLFMGKQGMARGMEERGMIAVVMGMLLNSFRTRSGSIVAANATVAGVTSYVNRIFDGSFTQEPCPCAPLPSSLAQSREGPRDEGTGVEIYTRRRGESLRTDRVEARKRHTESEVRDPEHHA
jgi:hypothetical protein